MTRFCGCSLSSFLRNRQTISTMTLPFCIPTRNPVFLPCWYLSSKAFWQLQCSEVTASCSSGLHFAHESFHVLIDYLCVFKDFFRSFTHMHAAQRTTLWTQFFLPLHGLSSLHHKFLYILEPSPQPSITCPFDYLQFLICSRY